MGMQQSGGRLGDLVGTAELEDAAVTRSKIAAAVAEAITQSQATFNVETLAGAKTLAINDARYQLLDPGGVNRDLNLPPAADAFPSLFHVRNTADAAEDLVAKDDGGTIVVTINQNDVVILVTDGNGWESMGLHGVT